MTEMIVTVGSTIGLHARPARIIAQAAQTLDASVILTHNGQSVVASSPLMIMSLGAEHGAAVTVMSEDESAARAIAELIEQDLDTRQRPLASKSPLAQ
ncbi:HPr family phosphocarrier protein [uncultured Tessaracoccus sp.]|uniref:HPr family phosphocarrier protein n=1 Tax=uncultured Tessaracoccus sp. TaxID=905023 RepID=UPI0026115771|nr:HPr family phosphocarrier protein [uncultured Tessaracoccus sp.]